MDNPINKPSLLKRINIWFIGTKHSLVKKINNFKTTEDYQSLKGIILDIFCLGLLSNIALINWIGFGILQILSLGCSFWLIKEKIVPLIVNIVGSINLVRNYK
jgi:hypothetical protein